MENKQLYNEPDDYSILIIKLLKNVRFYFFPI